MLVVLDFAAGGAPLAVPQLAGTAVSATVGRYPGTPPKRALFVADPVPTGRVDALAGPVSIADALAARSSRLAQGPWLDRVPVVLAGVAVTAGDPPHVRDAAGDRLDLVDDVPLWLLLALTGGHPADIFGELEAGRFRPLSVAGDGGLLPL